MDEIKAKSLEGQLTGKIVGEWTIKSLISNGKSAAVFLAEGLDGEVAVKIFDTELIARYGDDTQFSRIERELELVGKSHPNLVRILGGGFDTITQNHYVVMEYLNGPNLKQCLQEVRAESIPKLVEQLASAAKFLEEQGYVHRDIKPENIAVLDDFQRAVLLDLGVLRPLSGSDLTDSEGIQAFIGTLQYSSPEFLLRQEEPTEEGWRALTFYQLGAVLHDLIMRKQLFAESSQPYARLVNAVQHETPEIQNTAIPYYLVELARVCLLKPWRTRLRLVKWMSFDEPVVEKSEGHSTKQRVTNRTVISRALSEPNSPEEDSLSFENLKLESLAFLQASARTIRSENSALPPVRILAKTPNDLAFGIQFKMSGDCALKQDLTIFFHLDIVDCAARVIALTACAYSGAYNRELIHPQSTLIFQGTYDGQATYTALEHCIYDLVDQAQDDASVDKNVEWYFPRRGL
jgi:serine/threonine protein kinase